MACSTGPGARASALTHFMQLVVNRHCLAHARCPPSILMCYEAPTRRESSKNKWRMTRESCHRPSSATGLTCLRASLSGRAPRGGSGAGCAGAAPRRRRRPTAPALRTTGMRSCRAGGARAPGAACPACAPGCPPASRPRWGRRAAAAVSATSGAGCGSNRLCSGSAPGGLPRPGARAGAVCARRSAAALGDPSGGAGLRRGPWAPAPAGPPPRRARTYRRSSRQAQSAPSRLSAAVQAKVPLRPPGGPRRGSILGTRLPVHTALEINSIASHTGNPAPGTMENSLTIKSEMRSLPRGLCLHLGRLASMHMRSCGEEPPCRRGPKLCPDAAVLYRSPHPSYAHPPVPCGSPPAAMPARKCYSAMNDSLSHHSPTDTTLAALSMCA